MAEYLEELCKFLRSDIKPINVVVMPDFFLDRLVTIKQNTREFFGNIENAAKNKGGSIDGISQIELRGGNAVNTASALASLNMKVTPIVCTTRLGLQLLRHHLKTPNIDFSHVKIVNNASMTTALEFEAQQGKANVMLRSVGSLADFGPKYLDKNDRQAIRKADYVCVFNWAGAKNHGTELAETVLREVKTKGKGKTYCDTADPTPNREKIPELLRNVLRNKHLDVLSVNENEAICYATQLNSKTINSQTSLPLEEKAREAAKTLASSLTARIDLHTTCFSATYDKKREHVVPVFKVPVQRTTGAGDTWNAGNIIGDAYELSDCCRLALANALAAYYISNPAGNHPTKTQLSRFCEKLRKHGT